MSKKIHSKVLAGLLAIAMVIFIAPATHAAVGDLTLTGTPVQGNGTFGLSGSCSTAGNVTFSLLNSNSVSTPLSTNASTANSNNTFSTNLSIPNSYATGPTTLVATCPNGSTFSSAINVLAPSTDMITFNTPLAALNGTVAASGICGASNNGNTVTFTLNRSGTITSLPATAVANGANAAFTSNILLPANTPAGLATLTANCGNGQTVSTLAVIGDPSLINLALSPTNPTLNGAVNISGVCPTASSSVSFTVNQNGITTNLGSATSASNGAYSSNFTLPSSLTAGSANIIATCNNNGGSSTTNATLNSAAATTDPTSLPAGSIAGVTTTPVGGVNAGNGGTADLSSIGLFFLLTGALAIGLLSVTKEARQNNLN